MAKRHAAKLAEQSQLLAALFTLGAVLTSSLATAQSAAPDSSAPPAAGTEPEEAVSAPVGVTPAPIAVPAPGAQTTASSEGATAQPADMHADAVGSTAEDRAAMDAALEEQLNAALGSEAISEEYRLNAYGFVDFTFVKPLEAKGNIGVPRYSSFAVGNFNAYLEANLGDRWRTLGEVRLMYLPNGVAPYGGSNAAGASRTNTTVSDPADINRPLRWGGIEIERVWLEYEAHSLLTLRAGQWLTPYGIWNVDHGSPVIIGTRRPYIVGEGLFPERQTGLEAYGSLFLGAAKLGYHLTLSNGRGPADSFQDFDHDKALGARLYAVVDGELGTLSVGMSGYRGSYTDSTEAYVVENNEVFRGYTLVEGYDEVSFAGDAKWEWHGALAQAEVIANERTYSEGGRLRGSSFGGLPPGFQPDDRRVGFYGLLAYRTPWLNIMPFLGGEYYSMGNHTPTPTIVVLWAGVNVRPTPRVVLKVQLDHVRFPSESASGVLIPTGNVFNSQIAWSF